MWHPREGEREEEEEEEERRDIVFTVADYSLVVTDVIDVAIEESERR